MGNITIGRYEHPESVGYWLWIEPEDKSWIAYAPTSGKPVLFLDRDPETGAVL